MSEYLGGKRGRTGNLRQMLSGKEPILAPGAYDALTARIYEQAGFPAIYMTGFGTSASLLGPTLQEALRKASQASVT